MEKQVLHDASAVPLVRDGGLQVVNGSLQRQSVTPLCVEAHGWGPSDLRFAAVVLGDQTSVLVKTVRRFSGSAEESFASALFNDEPVGSLVAGAIVTSVGVAWSVWERCRRSPEMIRQHENGDRWFYCTGCSWRVLVNASGRVRGSGLL